MSLIATRLRSKCFRYLDIHLLVIYDCFHATVTEIVVTETVWPTNPKVLIIWSLTKAFCQVGRKCRQL